MATLKFSQITPASSAPAPTDQIVGIGGGTTDYLYSVSQLASVVGGSIGGPVAGGGAASVLFVDSTTGSTSKRQVANRTYFYDTLTSGAGQANVQTYHYARDDITSIQVGWAGFYLNASHVETANTGTNVLTAAVWYNGVAYQLKFAAATSGTIPNNGFLISDVLSVTIPRGAKFYIRSYQTFSVAVVSPTVQGALGRRDTSNGDAVNFTASDQTVTGTVVDAGGAIAAQWPCLILAQSNRPAILCIGDSRGWGAADNVQDGFGALGYLERSVAPDYAETNICQYGDTASAFAARTLTNGLFQYFTHVLCQYGANDLSQGASSATTLSRLQAVYALFTGGQKIYQTTIEPSTTSTDSWATLANQTVTSWNANRVSVNGSIRAGLANVTTFFDVASVLESSLNSGLWEVPNYTNDGVHPLPIANQQVAAANVIYAGAFTGSTTVLGQDPNFTYSPGSRMLTASTLRLLSQANPANAVLIQPGSMNFQGLSSSILVGGVDVLDYNLTNANAWSFNKTVGPIINSVGQLKFPKPLSGTGMLQVDMEPNDPTNATFGIGPIQAGSNSGTSRLDDTFNFGYNPPDSTNARVKSGEAFFWWSVQSHYQPSATPTLQASFLFSNNGATVLYAPWSMSFNKSSGELLSHHLVIPDYYTGEGQIYFTYRSGSTPPGASIGIFNNTYAFMNLIGNSQTWQIINDDAITTPTGALRFRDPNSGNIAVRFYPNSSVSIGPQTALATTAVAGFLYIPSCAGTPTGTPTALGAGTVPMVYDTTNNKFYIYNGGWKGGTTPGAFT